ncbi:MAG: DMT family transporter [Candidatus Thorarchaeota archaeon]|nr:DMT family transporter [Candidatus Thorarchaeota archaeon]
MQATPEFYLGVLSGVFGSALYAISVVVYRGQRESIRPLDISSVKMWTALPLMVLLVLAGVGQSPELFPVETVLLLSLSILLGAVIGDTLYLVSQERIGVSYAFPVAMSFPILTYFLTVAFLGEPLIVLRLVGACVAVLWVIILSREQNSHPADPSPASKRRLDVLGLSLAILTAVLYAVGTTILQVGVKDVDPIGANLVRVGVGSAAFVPLSFAAHWRGMMSPSKHAVLIVAISGFFGMGIGSILYVYAVKFAGAAVSSVIASSAPLFALPVSVLALKEQVSRIAALGVVATVAGVLMVVLGG